MALCYIVIIEKHQSNKKIFGVKDWIYVELFWHVWIWPHVVWSYNVLLSLGELWTSAVFLFCGDKQVVVLQSWQKVITSFFPSVVSGLWKDETSGWSFFGLGYWREYRLVLWQDRHCWLGRGRASGLWENATVVLGVLFWDKWGKKIKGQPAKQAHLWR